MPVKKNGTLKNIKGVSERFKVAEFLPGIILGAVVVVVVGILVFNYFRSGTTGQLPETSKEQAQEQQSKESGFTPKPLPAEHQVVRGDSLVKIAREYYNDQSLWPGIAKTNNLEKPSTINPDQKITVPKKEEAGRVSVNDLRKSGREKIESNQYTIDYGDTLFDIAQRAYGDGSKWTLINQANQLGKLPNGNPLIHAGNVLLIPR